MHSFFYPNTRSIDDQTLTNWASIGLVNQQPSFYRLLAGLNKRSKKPFSSLYHRRGTMATCTYILLTPELNKIPVQLATIFASMVFTLYILRQMPFMQVTTSTNMAPQVDMPQTHSYFKFKENISGTTRLQLNQVSKLISLATLSSLYGLRGFAHELTR